MGLLHEKIKNDLKVIASHRRGIARAEASLALHVEELLKVDAGTPPPQPEAPMDPAREHQILKRLRKLGYVPKRQ